MKTAAVISIGNELLTGETVDTNAPWLCAELRACGIPAVSVTAVGDDESAIIAALQHAADRADVLILTGGLGPTGDDLTRSALAAFLGSKLEFHQPLLDHIAAFFASRNLQMPDTNRLQAYLPAGTTPIPNETGTAPGILAEHRGKLIACLPGVPSEMKQMFVDHLKPHCKSLAADQHLVTRKLMCCGLGESAIAQMLGPRMDRSRNPLVNTTASAGIVTIYVVASAPDRSTAEQLADAETAAVRDTLGPAVYGRDDQTLAEVVGQMLAERGKTLAIAESCTGGLIAKLITDVPGSSRYFKCGWVTYANEAKIRDLNVPPQTIEQHGAVSEPVALAMARGAKARAAADYAIATTGIAGPTGGTSEKPVGLVYIALDTPGGPSCRRLLFPTSRRNMRLRTALAALDMLRLEL
ncbi:MAG TPA: competence/damage-inducible protein A [Anaerohalosphaeraceae bacterium]|jgi:nicotinamide-nucleotide amidase|nr:competence/damage-inducible protein A [Anaerohalosphaeraceae bacterium]HRT50062.1 competence/damage-inducible protein A [Anaerohalosphaeraceae bacterium]HRT85865.1 competence/damage-inducible protein A [Anaerohalosphaeraceae bacterium]